MGGLLGKTTPDGSAVEGKMHRVADLFATLYHQFGIEPNAEFTTSFDSPTKATDDGKVIEELLG